MEIYSVIPQRLDVLASPKFARVLVGDGSVSAPGFGFTDALTTGLYRSGSGSGEKIHFAIGGSQKAFVTGQGFGLDDQASANFGILSFGGTAMTANRTLTLDLNNTSSTLEIESNSILNQDYSSDSLTVKWPQLTFDMAQDYVFAARSTNIAIQSQTDDVTSGLELFTKKGDSGDGCVLNIFGFGTPSSFANRDFVQLGFSGGNYILNAAAAGSQSVPDLRIYTGANTTQLVLNTDNSIDMSGSLDVVGTVQAEQLTSTDDITMQGHLFTLGDGSANDIVLSFDGSANDATIIFDESADQFLFGDADIQTSAFVITQRVQGFNDPDTYFIFTADQCQIWAGGAHMIKCFEAFVGDKVEINPALANIDFRVHGDSVSDVLVVDAGTDQVNLKTTTIGDGGATNYTGISNTGDITQNGSGRFIESSKFKITSIGGYAIKLTNKTGGNTVQGQTVKADTATDDGVILTAADDNECFGVFLDAGIADDAEAWVVIAGIADVAMGDDEAATRGNWVETNSAEAGYADATSGSPAAAPQHFNEIGHCIESVAASGGGTHILARCILHFN